MALEAFEARSTAFTENSFSHAPSFLDISWMCTDCPFLNAADPEHTSDEIAEHPRAYPKHAFKTACYLESNYQRSSNGVPSSRLVRGNRITDPVASNEPRCCVGRALNWRYSSWKRVHDCASGHCSRHRSSQWIQRPHGSTLTASSAERWRKIEAFDQFANEMPIQDSKHYKDERMLQSRSLFIDRWVIQKRN